MDALLPLLPTLVHLARSGSVSQTARELGIPRSTVSRRLGRLEEVMKVKLAERTTHRFQLTGAGRLLVEGAVGALAQLETVREQVVATAGQVRGQLRVSMAAGMSGAFIGWFLALLHARHPGIDIELAVSERGQPRLEEGFDIVMVMGVPEPSGWLRRRLTEAQLVAVASPDYLATHGTPASTDALSGHVLLASHAEGGAPSWPRLKGGRVPISPKLLTNDLSTLREAVRAGIGIAVIPMHVVLAELAAGELVHVLPTILGQAIDVFALYLPERRASPVLKAVLAAVSEFAAEQTSATRKKQPRKRR